MQDVLFTSPAFSSSNSLIVDAMLDNGFWHQKAGILEYIPAPRNYVRTTPNLLLSSLKSPAVSFMAEQRPIFLVSVETRGTFCIYNAYNISLIPITTS